MVSEKWLKEHGFKHNNGYWELTIKQFCGYSYFITCCPSDNRLCMQYSPLEHPAGLNNIELYDCDSVARLKKAAALLGYKFSDDKKD